MRFTRSLFKIKQLEESFQKVDRSIEEALGAQEVREARANFDDAAAPGTFAGRVAATPELADIYLSVNTRLGKSEILVKPIEGNPTGLTNVFEHPDPKGSLLSVYDHTLALIKDKFPATSVYRTGVENLTKARREIVEKAQTKEEVEQAVGSGLIEEILFQAADEFRLAELLAEHKVWEDLEEVPVPGQWEAHAIKTHDPAE